MSTNRSIDTLPDGGQEPNGFDERNVPSVIRSGQENPPDPSNTLLPDSTKYDLTSNQWLAIPLAPGKYNIRSREEGQVIYVASNPNSNSALRVSKAFDIETAQRTAVYVKGQSQVDILLDGMQKQISQKRDISDSYSKNETQEIIRLAVSQGLQGLTNTLEFKGVLDTKNDLDSLDLNTVTIGDVYQISDTGIFYVAVEKNNQKIWEKLSGTIVNLQDYYTKQEVDVLLLSKVNESQLKTLENQVNNIKPAFNWKSDNDPALDPRPAVVELDNLNQLNNIITPNLPLGSLRYVKSNRSYYELKETTQGNKSWEIINYEAWVDPTEEGETWFKPNEGLIFVRKRSNLDGNLFWLNAVEGYMVTAGRNTVTINTNQVITGLKTFHRLPIMDTDVNPQYERQLVTKSYVDNAINGTTNIPNDVAILSANQTFTGENIFNNQPKIANPENFNNLDDNKLVTKAQVKQMDNFDTNPTIITPKSWDNLSDNDLVTKGVLNSSNQNIDTTNLATLNGDNTFQGINTFQNNLELLKDPVLDNEATRKSYVTSYVTTQITDNNNNYYTKTELDSKFSEYPKKSEMSEFMEFKGSLNNYSELTSLTNLDIGDVYYVKAPKSKIGFWMYDGTEWSNIGSGVSIDTTNLATLNGNNTFRGSNIFNTVIESGSKLLFQIGDVLNITGNDLFSIFNNNVVINNTKTTFNTNVDFTNKATFDSNGVSFNTNPIVENSKTMGELTPSSIMSKNQVEELIGQMQGPTIITSESTPSGIKPPGTLWMKISYAQDPNDSSVFTNTPGMFISLGEGKWWDIHKEVLYYETA